MDSRILGYIGWPIALGFLAIAFAILRPSRVRRNGQRLRKPPNTLPILGNGILFLQDRHKLFSWFVKCEQLFGFETFEISVPTLPPGVVINDPKNLEFVLKNEGIFSKGEFFKQRSWDLFGHGIINADGNLWKLQRKAGLNFLNKANLKALTEVALPKYLDEAVRRLEMHDNTPIDLDLILHEITTQLMGRMAYNMDLHAHDAFASNFEFASGATAERFQNPLYLLTEPFLSRKFWTSIRIVKDFGQSIVSEAIQRRTQLDVAEKGHLQKVPSGTLINSLLDSIDDPQIVADAALNYLSAGRDTTAQGLTWTFYLLMTHPEIAQKIRKELLNMDAKKGIETLDPSLLTPLALPYTMAVFYEALRFYPPVPFELKQAQEATVLPDGTALPKGAVLVWCTWAMNRSEQIWGSDAHLFKPERWLDNGKVIARNAFEYPVFNGGPRMCLGKNMAEYMAVQVIATLLSKFDFELVDGTERVTKNSLTLPMEGGLPCLVRKREADNWEPASE